MRRLLLALLLAGCQHPASPHAWEARLSIDHIPHAYFYCTAHGHEPRDAAEFAEAQAWYATQPH